MKKSFLIICLFLLTFPSFACKCAMNGAHFLDDLHFADQIFIGKILDKDTSNAVYYLFSVERVFKGDTTDTITIRSGFGGGDCGIVMESGITYLVFARNKETSRCHRTGNSVNHPDIIKLRFHFEKGFADNIGKNIDDQLTKHEAIYLNGTLRHQRKNFDFTGRKIAFVSNKERISKMNYFTQWGGKDVYQELVMLTQKEKQSTPIDAFIITSTTSRKKPITPRQRRKILRKLFQK